MAGFKELIQLIQQGELVKPGTPNRPLRNLDDNVRYLRDLIEAAEIGSAVFARDQTLKSDTKVGQPVYYNATTQRFELGLAATQTSTDGTLLTADSSHVWGVVYTKTNATLGDILLFGHAALDLSNALATGETVTAAPYYLSGATAGRLTTAVPPVTVPILRADGAGRVFVNIQWREWMQEHSHLKFNLVALPAGEHTPPAVNDRHTITNPDSATEGWLPADNAYLEWDRGEDVTQGFHGVPEGPTGLVLIDSNGIWWMSDCYGDVPWPTDLNTDVSDSTSDSDSIECPRETDMGLRLWFTKPTFLTNDIVVTSLISADSRVVVECENKQGIVASIGALQLRLDLTFLAVGQTNTSHLAFKTFDATTQTFDSGPVVGGLYAGGSNITLASANTSKLVPSNPSSATLHHGNVQISVDPSGGKELLPQVVRVDGVTEEYFQSTPYLGFPASLQTELRGRFNIPFDTLVSIPKIKLRLRILARAAGTLPALTVTGRRISTPASLGVGGAVALPSSDSAVTITTSGVMSANEYIDVESDEITVADGEDYLFTIKRLSTDGYAGEVGIMRMTAILID